MPMRDKLNRDCVIIIHGRCWIKEFAMQETQNLQMGKRNRMKTLVIERKRNVRAIRSKKSCKLFAGNFHVEVEYHRIETDKRKKMASDGKTSRGKRKMKWAEEKNKNVGHNLLMLKHLLSSLLYTSISDLAVLETCLK